MANLFTDVGLILMASNRARGLPTIVDEIRIGTLAAGDRYDATQVQIALVDPTPLVLVTDIDIGSSGPNVTYSISITSSPALRASEVGFFVNGTLVIVIANQADDLFNKGLNTNALLSISYSLSNGIPTSVNITVDISVQQIVKASDDEAASGRNNVAYVTPQGVRLFYEANPPPAINLNNAIPIGLCFPFFGEDSDIPGNYLPLKGGFYNVNDYYNLSRMCEGKFGNLSPLGSTFRLPDTRHRTIIGDGGSTGGGVGNIIGDVGGNSLKTLDINEMPSHRHRYTLDSGPINTGNDAYGGRSRSPANDRSHSTTSVGGGQSFSLMQPSLVLNCIVKAR